MLNLNDKILEDLSDKQKLAVTHDLKPLLIIAGPGSGKTRVMSHRIPWLVNNFDVKPYEILAVTFTNKAAKEMQNRVSSILKMEAIGLSWLGTFHSICAKLLRKHAAAVNLNSNFTIIDQDDQVRLIKYM